MAYKEDAADRKVDEVSILQGAVEELIDYLAASTANRLDPMDPNHLEPTVSALSGLVDMWRVRVGGDAEQPDDGPGRV